jgi:hypothetical protein
VPFNIPGILPILPDEKKLHQVADFKSLYGCNPKYTGLETADRFLHESLDCFRQKYGILFIDRILILERLRPVDVIYTLMAILYKSRDFEDGKVRDILLADVSRFSIKIGVTEFCNY